MAERAAAHHFETADQQRHAVTLGMWVFLLTEIMLFGGLFTGYAFYRTLYPETFAEASHHLHFWLGTLNTVVLITSSLTMVLAVRSVETSDGRSRNRKVAFFLALTLLLGFAFLAIKAREYSLEIEEGFLPTGGFRWPGEHEGRAALFFGFYWVMTGLHAFHMIVGISLVAVVASLTWTGRLPEPVENKIEITGLYWHLIDVIWIFIYPLLYLIE